MKVVQINQKKRSPKYRFHVHKDKTPKTIDNLYVIKVYSLNGTVNLKIFLKDVFIKAGV